MPALAAAAEVGELVPALAAAIEVGDLAPVIAAAAEVAHRLGELAPMIAETEVEHENRASELARHGGPRF